MSKDPFPQSGGDTALAPVARRPVLVVTGLAGSGLSTALKTLEDLGYQAVDNLPLALLPALVAEQGGAGQPLAIGVDSRAWDFSAARLSDILAAIRREETLEVKLIYMECQEQEVQKRFAETRRVHPLAKDRPVADGVARDITRMSSLRENADLVIDTTEMSARALRRLVSGHFSLVRAGGQMSVFVTSFGFKYGLPRDADLVFDVRFLDNPYWQPALRPLSGRDEAIASYIRADTGYADFAGQVRGLLAVVLPRYVQEGRHYLTVAIGCTGGRHRSVFTAEELASWIEAQGYRVGLRHRDIDRGEKAA